MSLAPLPIQAVAVIAELVSVRAIFALILRYLTTQRTRIVVVIDAICERFFKFVNGVEVGSRRHGGRTRLRAPDPFGSCDVFLVAFSEQTEMLSAQKVSPLYRSIHDEPERSTFGAFLRLAVFDFCRVLHADNYCISSDSFQADSVPKGTL